MTALLFGIASFVVPFVTLKENRVVDGMAMSGIRVSDPFIIALSVLFGVAVMVAALLLRKKRLRHIIYTLVGFGCFWLIAALLVRSEAFLSEGSAPRVSPSAGFWMLLATAYILIKHSQVFRHRARGWGVAIVLLIPVVVLLSGGRGESLSVIQEWHSRKGRFLDELLIHIRLFATAVIAAGVIGIPLGTIASRNRKIGGPVIAFVDAAQTIPSMALFGLLIAPLAALSRAVPALRALGLQGIGTAPALIALTLYALLPIVRNTVVGLASVPLSVYEAGRGMGMSFRQLFWQVEGPMALPYILTGLRTASVQAVGNTAVAALIGAGGLGIMIFQGLGQAAPDLILLGVLPLTLMAIVVNRVWEYAIFWTVSPGLRQAGA